MTFEWTTLLSKSQKALILGHPTTASSEVSLSLELMLDHTAAGLGRARKNKTLERRTPLSVRRRPNEARRGGLGDKNEARSATLTRKTN